MERAQARYERNQQDALTHDITAVENCKILYLGDAVNVSRLFEQLPLNHVERKYKIDSENCALPPEVEGCYSLHTSVTGGMPESIR